jgi:Na+-driven multidrug efflux pump
MEDEIKLRPRMLFVRNKLLFGDFLRLAVPALANDIIWGVAYSMYSVILGHLSTDAVAANSIVSVVRNLATVVCFAVASAAGILLGHTMGENKPEQARAEAKRLMRITVLTAAVGGLGILAASPLILRFANLTDTAKGYLRIMLLINTYYPIGMAVNTTAICGFFRAGGDSRFGFICDTITMWAYAVPMGFFVAFVLKLPVMWVYFLLCTDEFVKWPVVIHHYLKGGWIKNITRENIG